MDILILIIGFDTTFFPFPYTVLRSGHSLVQASRQILSKDASPHQLEIYMSEGWLILMPIAKPPTVRVGMQLQWGKTQLEVGFEFCTLSISQNIS